MIYRKTVQVILNLSVRTETEVRIDDVNFLPDEVILRSVSSNNLAASGEFFASIWCSLTNQVLFSQALVPGPSSSNQSYEIHFPMDGRIVQGHHVFRALDQSGHRIRDGDYHSTISFQLEFVKYS